MLLSSRCIRQNVKGLFGYHRKNCVSTANCSGTGRYKSNLSGRSSNSVDDFKWFLPVQTRWKDNDIYGHVNNAVYHAYFDTVINVYLIRFCGIRPDSHDGLVGFMVQTQCSYSRPASYPNVYLSGLSVAKIGKSSVNYTLGLFELEHPTHQMLKLDPVKGHWAEEAHDLLEHVQGESPCCQGTYTHVFVDPNNEKRPSRIDGALRQGLEKILVPQL